MRRFIVLALFGGLLTLAGHAVISLGLHPESVASVALLLQGCAALVVGAALFATGMLGLAEGYEKVVGRVAPLLHTKDLRGDAEQIPLHDLQGLGESNRLFWQGYSRAAGGVALFLAGLLLLAAVLYRTSPQVFTVAIAAAVVVLAVVALTLSIKGLRRVRRAHAGADESARRLERLPDRQPEAERPTVHRRVPRHTLFPRQGLASTGRGLDRERHVAGQRLGSHR